MKRFFIIFFVLLWFQSCGFTNDDIYTTDNLDIFVEHKKYGLKNKNAEIVVKAQYKKLIRLDDNAWIVQKNNKFGLIDCYGNYLVKPKYAHAERMFNKWVKLGNDKDYGLYNSSGKAIIPPEFVSIEPLFGHKFLTYKNYKYGIYSDTGEIILDNEYEFIYMPDPKTMRIKYNNNWYEIEKIKNNNELKLSKNDVNVKLGEENFKVTKVLINTGLNTGYTVVSALDYLLKVFSVLSPAYENTIDELMLSQGAETVSIFMKLSWIPKFPYVYAKKYYDKLITPNSSPLSAVRVELKEQLK